MRSARFGALTTALWIAFLVWTVVVALVWTLGIGEAEVLAWARRQFHLPPLETGTAPPRIAATFVSLLGWVDPVWIVLAAVNAYALTAAREGLAVARRWSAIIVVVVLLIAWLSAATALPLGPLRYTELLGRRLGPVPLGLPLLWLAALLGARDLVLRVRPSISQLQLAVGAGALALLFDLALEPIAWKARVFWLWYPAQLPAPSWPPVQNYVTWFVVGAGLVFALREQKIVTVAPPMHRSPAAICVLIFAVLLVANAARLRG